MVQVASFGSSANGTSFAIPVTTGASAGDHCIALLVVSGGSGKVTGITDSQGNTWQQDAEVAAGTSLDGLLYSTHVTTALTTSDTITVSLSASRALAALIESASGLAGTSWFRAAGTYLDSSNGNTFDTAAAATAASAGDLLMGLLGTTATAGTVTVSAPSGLSSLGTASSSGTARSVYGYSGTASGGEDEFSGSFTSSRAAIAALGIYAAASGDEPPAYSGSVTAAATLSAALSGASSRSGTGTASGSLARTVAGSASRAGSVSAASSLEASASGASARAGSVASAASFLSITAWGVDPPDQSPPAYYGRRPLPPNAHRISLARVIRAG